MVGHQPETCRSDGHSLAASLSIFKTSSVKRAVVDVFSDCTLPTACAHLYSLHHHPWPKKLVLYRYSEVTAFTPNTDHEPEVFSQVLAHLSS